jgi:hypothetical protein
MRKILCFFVLAAFVFYSCKKDNVNRNLLGRWEMISVQNDSANTVTNEPADLNFHIDILFSFNAFQGGELSGTLTESIGVKGKFFSGKNADISIPEIGYTYPGFDIFWGSSEWDQQFESSITLAKQYLFDASGNLQIICSNNRTLVFKKL